MNRFNSICYELVSHKQTRAFAFIFYDFGSNSLRRILKDQGVFTKLDRLAGPQLSIFFLHATDRQLTQDFNSYFLTLLGVKNRIRLPSIVFFRVSEQEIKDVEFAELDGSDLIHGFSELYGAIENFVRGLQAAPAQSSSAVTWSRGASNVFRLDDFRDALKRRPQHF